MFPKVIQANLGILGGGQLARMLLLSAHPLGLRTSVFAAHAQDPAAQVCGQSFLGSLEDRLNLRKFLSSLDSVTFESEFVDTEKLKRCVPTELNVFPKLSVIAQLQDRLPQKQLLDHHRIATAPWRPVQDLASLKAAAKDFVHSGYVLKQRRFGYDGYGTFVYEKAEVDPQVLLKSAHGFIAEEKMPFQKELAISFVRSKSEFVALPLVESVQVNSRCFSVCGPIQHKGIKKLTQQFKALMRDLDYIGILAVELFNVNGDLVVNELAPRVHNSGHYSQDALTCSQFEYHWRAGLNLPLPPVRLKSPGFAMVNLLGEGGQKVHLSYSPLGHLHWYGKTENRAGRKLGHINTLGTSPKAALKTALRWRKEFAL